MVSKYGNNLGSYITQREPGAALLVRDEKKATIRAAALYNMYEMLLLVGIVCWRWHTLPNNSLCSIDLSVFEMY